MPQFNDGELGGSIRAKINAIIAEVEAGQFSAGINNTPIGASTPSSGVFTNLSATGVVDFSSASTLNLGSISFENITVTGDTNTAAGATWTNLGTVNTVDIDGGTIDGATIGGAAQAAGSFTDITTSGRATFGAEIRETVFALSGTTPALNPANGTVQTWTLSGNSAPTDSIETGEYILLHIDDGSGFTITWPTMIWVGGSAPTLDTTNENVILLWKIGSQLYGSYIGAVS